MLRTALVSLVGGVALGELAGAAPGDRARRASEGLGRQTFIGGSGVAYGMVFSGGSLVITDYSAAHDLKIESPVVPTTNADGSRTFAPAGGTRSVAFRVSGTLYRVTVTGASTYNAVGVYGRLQLRGKGVVLVNGQRNRWNGPAWRLGKVPKVVKPLFELALMGAPPPLPPPPVTPPPPPPVTTAA
jgi:hypothetical protein